MDHHRRSVRIKGQDYTQPGAYFITICTQDREPVFGEIRAGTMHLNQVGKMAAREWERLVSRFRALEPDEYVIMPDHIHGILRLTELAAPAGIPPTREQFGKPVAGSIPTIVRAYKSTVTQQYQVMAGRSAPPLWQRNYYEHVIRSEADLIRVRAYIRQNPNQWENDQRRKL